MNILLLNAGSSSLKCSLMESDSRRVIAAGLADWAGSTTHYQYVGKDDKKRAADVPWQGHAEAVRRFLHDLAHLHAIIAALRDAEPVSSVERI